MQWGMIPRFHRAVCDLRPVEKSLGSKAVRLRTGKCFPVCARKRTYLPILELLSPPTLSGRRHRGLARRLVTVRRCGGPHGGLFWQCPHFPAVGGGVPSIPNTPIPLSGGGGGRNV